MTAADVIFYNGAVHPIDPELRRSDALAVREGRIVALGDDVKELKGHRGPVRTAAFSPDGKLAATASEDRTVRIWDVAEAKELRVMKHEQAAIRLTWSPDSIGTSKP